MIARYTLATVAALAICLGLDFTGQAGGVLPARQRYSGWSHNKAKNYYYRKYEYRATPASAEYETHYVIYYKNDPKINNTWVYFYNPKTETYWARYPTVHHENYHECAHRHQAWSIVPVQNYQAQRDLHQIDQAKYFPNPQSKQIPAIPGGADDVGVLAPPMDLP